MADLSIRGIDGELLPQLKAQAALRGVTLRQFVIDILQGYVVALTNNGAAPRRIRKPTDSNLKTLDEMPDAELCVRVGCGHDLAAHSRGYCIMCASCSAFVRRA
jgi:hypothetical protein